EERDKVDSLEELASPNFARTVVNPDPEPILDPLEIRMRPGSSSLLQGCCQCAASIPNELWVFHADVEIRYTDKLEVDVEQRRPLQRGRGPRAPPRVSRGPGEGVAQAVGKPRALGHHRAERFGNDSNPKGGVGEPGRPAGVPGARHSDAEQTALPLQTPN